MNYSNFKLKNGIRVILAPMEQTRAVTVLVLVGTGSKYEEERTQGISHFLEHMFFKGTKKRPSKREMAELLDGVGAEFNAFTGQEYTGYYVKVEKTHAPLAIDIVSDILQNPIFPPKEIVLEKNVIFEEINMYADNPMHQIHEHWQKLLYGDQPAGRDIAGTKEAVGGITRRDLTEYFEKQYRSNNMVVCVAGGFVKDKMRKDITKAFANVRPGDAKGKLAVREYQTKPAAHVVSRASEQTHIMLGVRGYSMSDTRRHALDVLAYVLGGGMSSRLFLSVRDNKGLVYYIRTGSANFTDSGYMVTGAGIDNTRFIDAIKEIMKEYRSVKKNGITQKELKKAKGAMRGRSAIALEESNEVASFLSMGEILQKKIWDLEEEIRLVEKVTVKDVKEVAQDVLTYDKMNIAVLGPQKNTKILRELIENI